MIDFKSLFLFYVKIDPSYSQSIVLKEKQDYVISFFDESEKSYQSTITIRGDFDTMSIKVYGKIVSKKNTKKTINITIILDKKHQSALLDIKGISDQKGVLEIIGGCILTKSSYFCNAKIFEKVVILSSCSRAKITPILRVETENVEYANHSASISPFSPDVFFFLESRGISKKIAKQLLIQSIIGDNIV